MWEGGEGPEQASTSQETFDFVLLIWRDAGLAGMGGEQYRLGLYQQGSPDVCIFLSELMKSDKVLEKRKFLFYFQQSVDEGINLIPKFFPSKILQVPPAAEAGLSQSLLGQQSLQQPSPRVGWSQIQSPGVCSLTPRAVSPQAQPLGTALCALSTQQYKAQVPSCHQSRFITNTEGDVALGRLGTSSRRQGWQ